MPQNMDSPIAPDQSPRGHWLRMILMGTVILVCGMLIGGAVTSRVAWKRFIDRTRNQDKITERIAGRMHRNLDLTEEQSSRIQDIIHRHQNNLQDIHLEVRPRVEEELKQMKREVNNVLTPEQARRWNSRYQRMHQHWLTGGPPPAPPRKPRGKGLRRLHGQGRKHAPPPGINPPDTTRKPLPIVEPPDTTL